MEETLPGVAVALARSSGSLSMFTVCSPSEGCVVSVLGEVLRADLLVLWARRGGLVCGSVCWLVGVRLEATAVPLVAAHSRRQSMTALKYLSLWT